MLKVPPNVSLSPVEGAMSVAVQPNQGKLSSC